MEQDASTPPDVPHVTITRPPRERCSVATGHRTGPRDNAGTPRAARYVPEPRANDMPPRAMSNGRAGCLRAAKTSRLNLIAAQQA